MAVSGKYGKVDVTGIAADEPIFIIRAQDRLAEAALELYRALAASHGAAVAAGVDRERDRFRNWKGKKKLPD
ncbi:MAG: hypothetical protein ACREFP_01510 [Acetobacteraceae bacterium]